MSSWAFWVPSPTILDCWFFFRSSAHISSFCESMLFHFSYFFSKEIYVSMYKYVHVCAGVRWSPEEGTGSPGVELTGGCLWAAQHGCWGLNSRSLQEHRELSWLLSYFQLFRLEFLIDMVYLDVCILVSKYLGGSQIFFCYWFLNYIVSGDHAFCDLLKSNFFLHKHYFNPFKYIETCFMAKIWFILK